jgi:hypothetical protein
MGAAGMRAASRYEKRRACNMVVAGSMVIRLVQHSEVFVW